MHYEKYGVNIMKNIYNRQSLSYGFMIILVLIVYGFSGCSSDSSNENSDATDVQEVVVETPIVQKELLTVQDTIEAALSDAMERLRYFDNSGLYENEFAYLTDESSFDDYLTFGQITQRPQADVTELMVDSLWMYAHDSASVWVSIVLEYPGGKVDNMTDQKLKVYYHKGNWIKPTVSVIKYQLEYDELIRQAEEASQWEDQ